MQNFKEVNPSLVTPNYKTRAYSFHGKACIRCGFNNPLALEIHHIDRNRHNNDLENLEVLCSNCHSIEHRKKS
jgi:5-methylcytosine-specific restriction endonuclease McrA